MVRAVCENGVVKMEGKLRANSYSPQSSTAVLATQTIERDGNNYNPSVNIFTLY